MLTSLPLRRNVQFLNKSATSPAQDIVMLYSFREEMEASGCVLVHLSTWRACEHSIGYVNVFTRLHESIHLRVYLVYRHA